MLHMRNTREDETREQEVRPTDWYEPSLLEMPEMPPGFEGRWIRVVTRSESGGIVDDTAHISRKLQEGYKFVKPDDLQGIKNVEKLALRDSGRYQGYIGHGDVVLAMIPIAKREARAKYFEEKTMNQANAVKEQLRKYDDKKYAPMFDDSKTSTKMGRRAHIDD